MKGKLPVLALIAGLGCSISVGQNVTQPYSDAQFGIVDCFIQGDVNVSSVRGVIVDPTGVPVPGAVVLLTADSKPSLHTKSDDNGQFSIAVSPGKYIFKVNIEPFSGPEIGLSVGKDLVSLFHPTKLNVLLGLPGSFCPWVATDNRKFQRAIDGNKKMLKEHTKHNAAQK